MDNKFEKYYQEDAERQIRYKEIKDKEGSEEELEEVREEIKKIREEYKDWCKRIQEEGDEFTYIYRLYEKMKERGNDYIDIDEMNNPDRVKGYIKAFREYGIQFFTYSSTWSSSIDSAWEFVKNGCTLCGIMEFNGDSRYCFSSREKETEVLHGYLFKVM